MRHLLLSAVCVAATDSNATFGALADRVEWTRVNDKASYDWPTTFILVTPPHTQCDDRTIRKSEKLCKRGENRSALEAYDAAAVEAATPFDGVVVVPIGESTARGLSVGALRHEDTNPYHFHDAGRLFVLEMLLNAFAIATSRRPPH